MAYILYQDAFCNTVFISSFHMYFFPEAVWQSRNLKYIRKQRKTIAQYLEGKAFNKRKRKKREIVKNP